MTRARPEPRPRIVGVFRAFGWLTGVAAALLALVAAAALGDAGLTPESVARAYGFAMLAAALLLGFGSAMLFGFATNLEILHEIRVALRGRKG
jgi:hypothetical protein